MTGFEIDSHVLLLISIIELFLEFIGDIMVITYLSEFFKVLVKNFPREDITIYLIFNLKTSRYRRKWQNR